MNGMMVAAGLRWFWSAFMRGVSFQLAVAQWKLKSFFVEHDKLEAYPTLNSQKPAACRATSI
jgi:hypothetical protein